MQSLPGYEWHLSFVGVYGVPGVYIAFVYYFLFCNACTLNWGTVLAESV